MLFTSSFKYWPPGICQHYGAWPACRDSILLAVQLDIFIMITLKLTMGISKIQSRTSQVKKFSMKRVNLNVIPSIVTRSEI